MCICGSFTGEDWTSLDLNTWGFWYFHSVSSKPLLLVLPDGTQASRSTFSALYHPFSVPLLNCMSFTFVIYLFILVAFQSFKRKAHDRWYLFRICLNTNASFLPLPFFLPSFHLFICSFSCVCLWLLYLIGCFIWYKFLSWKWWPSKFYRHFSLSSSF